MLEPGAGPFYGVLLLILVFVILDVVSGHDYTLAAENMMIAAHEVGMGDAG